MVTVVLTLTLDVREDKKRDKRSFKVRRDAHAIGWRAAIQPAVTRQEMRESC